MSDTSGEREKREAGRYAADLVGQGTVIGLGTGSTVFFAMERLGERIKEGLEFAGVPTSYQAAFRARQYGIPLTDLDENLILDLTIDGADQVSHDLSLIKGRGGAQVREKIVAAASRRLYIVVDESKCASHLDAVVPVEVLPFAWATVTGSIATLGGRPVLREGQGKDGPVITDNGNFILDCSFGALSDPAGMEGTLDRIPGVVGSGLFAGFTKKTIVIVGGGSGCRVLPPSRAPHH
jgi:ribose 5-phosphate isomerase A